MSERRNKLARSIGDIPKVGISQLTEDLPSVKTPVKDNAKAGKEQKKESVVREKKTTSVSAKASPKSMQHALKLTLKDFDKVVNSTYYTDSKSSITFSQSDEFVSKLDGLVAFYNYKMKSNFKRQQVMRALLEGLLFNSGDAILSELEKIEDGK